MKSIKEKGTKGIALLVAMILCMSIIIPASLRYTKAGSLEPVLMESGGWLESAYVEWEPVEAAASYKVYVKKATDASFVTALDDELIRKYDDGKGSYYFRADAVGLAAGNYQMQVVPVFASGEDKSVATTTGTLEVKAHDRSGYAWVKGSSSGAYNDDGTLKSNAVVLYITEKTKDTVTLDVVTSNKGATTSATGLQNILNLYKKGLDSRPLCVRFIGQITDLGTLDKGDIAISGNGSAANKRLSCGLTFEGIGEDATAYGWGIRIKNASNVEIRNLAVMLCDSDEGDNIGIQQDCDHVWIHNCDLFYGMAGGDADQAKGDGALDTKKSEYVTHSYNHFWDSGKCNLQGGTSSDTSNYITYHHNWYDHSDSRHPRVRVATVHVYNNYYDGNSKYGIGSTTDSDIFAEANYFRNCKYPIMISEQGSDILSGGTFSGETGGMIKAYNNYIEGASSFISYADNSTSFDAYVVTSRDEQVPSTVKAVKGGASYNNFDTASDMYDYNVDTPQVAKTNVETYAGRMNGGDFDWTFTSADDTSYDVNKELMASIKAYKTNLISVGSSDNGTVQTPTESEKESETATTSENESATSGSQNESTTAGGSSGGTVVSGDYVQNFTANGMTSSFYSISGNLSKSKGSVTYNGLTLTQCLKMESGTSIKFTAPAKGKLTLVFGGSSDPATNKKVKLDGTGYVIDSTETITLDVAAGEHEVKKGDTINLFYMVYVPEQTETEKQPESETETETETESGTEKETGTEIEIQPTEPSYPDADVENKTPSGNYYGDSNNDSVVNVADAVILKQYLAGMTVTIDLEAADVNVNGGVDVSDAVMLLKKLAGYNIILGGAE